MKIKSKIWIRRQQNKTSMFSKQLFTVQKTPEYLENNSTSRKS